MRDEMDQSCWIDTVIATELAGATPMDCGHLGIRSDDAPFLAAHDFAYDSYAPGGAIRARTGSDTCADLVDRGACGIDLHQTLCLECAAPITSTYCPPR